MRWLLDTNAVIGLLEGHPRIVARMRRRAPQDLCLSVVVWHELLYGAHRSQRTTQNIARLEGLRLDILDLDAADAREAAAIRATLAAAGTSIGPYDVLIAGQARARGLTLVTRNLSEFRRVEGLRVEDWEA